MRRVSKDYDSESKADAGAIVHSEGKIWRWPLQNVHNDGTRPYWKAVPVLADGICSCPVAILDATKLVVAVAPVLADGICSCPAAVLDATKPMAAVAPVLVNEMYFCSDKPPTLIMRL